MALKELLPLIQQLKAWRHAKGFSQYEAARVLRDAGVPVTTDSRLSSITRMRALGIGIASTKMPRQDHRKGAALAPSTFNPDASALQLDEPLGQRQT
jgi:transcriptional regulator with XRE-family HTH domain